MNQSVPLEVPLTWVHESDFHERYHQCMNAAKNIIGNPDRINYSIISDDIEEPLEREPSAMDVWRSFHRLAPQDYRLTIILSEVEDGD